MSINIYILSFELITSCISVCILFVP